MARQFDERVVVLNRRNMYEFNTCSVEIFLMKRKFLLKILKSIQNFLVLNPYLLDPHPLHVPLHHFASFFIVTRIWFLV